MDISRLVTILRIAKGAEEPAPCLLMICAAWTCVLGKQGNAGKINGLLFLTLVLCSLKGCVCSLQIRDA